jgi:hypothetical protein
VRLSGLSVKLDAVHIERLAWWCHASALLAQLAPERVVTWFRVTAILIDRSAIRAVSGCLRKARHACFRCKGAISRTFACLAQSSRVPIDEA